MRKQQLKVIVNTFDERKARQLSRLFAQNDTWQVPTLLIQHTYAFVDPYELHGNLIWHLEGAGSGCRGTKTGSAASSEPILVNFEGSDFVIEGRCRHI